MKSSIIIGMAISAGALFVWPARVAAQEDQPFKGRYRLAQAGPPSVPSAVQPGAVSSSRAQADPSRPTAPQFQPSIALPPAAPPRQTIQPFASPTPRSRKRPLSRSELQAPLPSSRALPRERINSPPQRVEAKPRVVASASPARVTSKKSHPKKERSQQSQHEGNERPAKKSGGENSVQTAPDRRAGEHAPVVPMRTPPNPAQGPVRLPETTPLTAPSAPPPVVSEHPPQPPPQLPPQPRAQPQPPQRSPRPILNDLSEDERVKLHSAHQTALHDPNLAASRARYLDARKEFREKLRDALLKADPSVQPILEKIRRDKPDDH